MLCYLLMLLFLSFSRILQYLCFFAKCHYTAGSEQRHPSNCVIPQMQLFFLFSFENHISLLTHFLEFEQMNGFLPLQFRNTLRIFIQTFETHQLFHLLAYEYECITCIHLLCWPNCTFYLTLLQKKTLNSLIAALKIGQQPVMHFKCITGV